ncbi:hypothetical protein [Bacillus bombysepticus]|uniref:hypothetical protein n=1 Tax=Bacillus bombysepticus TaxID=658666 RepID=UPI003016DF77
MTIKMEKQVVVTKIDGNKKNVEFGYIQYSEKLYKEVDKNDRVKARGLGVLETELPQHLRENLPEDGSLELRYQEVESSKSTTKRFKHVFDLFTVYVPEDNQSIMLKEEEIAVHIQTTQDYFNKTTEELSVDRGNNYTREDCLVLDDGLQVHFYEKENSLKESIEYYLNENNSRLEIKAVLKTIDNRYALIMY